MPLDLLHPAPRRKIPFRDAKTCFGLLGIASSTVLVVSLAVLLSEQLLFAALPRLCAAIRCCLLRRYIFFAVNFIVLLLVLLKLTDREFGEEGTGGGGARLHEVLPDEWFDALSSPRSFGDVTTEDKGSILASPLEPLSDVTTEVNKSGFLQVSFLAPSRNVTTKVSGSNTPTSILDLADSFPGGNGFDEFYSCPPTPSRSPVSSPVPAGAVTNVKPLPPAEEADDSMEATWKVICRRATATLHLKKCSTWDDPPLVKAETAARGQLRKSEKFQEAAAAARTWEAPPSIEAVLSTAREQLRKSETFGEVAAGAKRAVLEKRVKGREVAIVEDRDEMNRRFDTFIKNFNEQRRLQRLASLRRRRYMGMNIL